MSAAGSGRTLVALRAVVQEGRRPDTPTHHGSSAGPRGRRRPDRDGLVHRSLDRPLRVARLARRVGVRRHRSVRRRRGLWARPRHRAVAPGPLPAPDPVVDPARGHRRPGRHPAPRGRGVHDALPAQAAGRQPALPAPAVLVPGRPDARLAGRRSGPSSSGLRARGYNARYMLVVGADPAAAEFADAVERHRELGLRVDRLPGRAARPGIGPGDRPSAGPRDPRRDRGRPARHGRRRGRDLPAAIEDWSLVEPITRLCEDEGKIVRIPVTETTPDHRPAAGSRTSTACRSCRSSTGRPDRSASSSSASSTSSSRRRRSILLQPAVPHRGGRHLAPGRPAGPLPPGPGRPPRAAVPCRQVPDDGPRRRGTA